MGKTIIIAMADGVSDACNITVNPKQFTISVTSNNTSYGTVSGDGVYTEGTTVTLRAVPKASYRFVCWLEGTTQVSTSYEYNFLSSKTEHRMLNSL